jgi:phosphopantothenoylcysteine decarboxylase/phosphopantothenate--cysteine ligase
MLRGLRVVVLVSGGIAAYKVADLVSQLTAAGVPVRVAMTEAATRFVGPATFKGLSGRPVLTDLWSPAGAAEPHVELGDWAQLVLLAPATADVLAKYARGEAADLVTATLLATPAPVVVAPAMNDAMWANAAVRGNLEALRGRSVTIVEPEAGRLASGHEGEGRLAPAGAILGGMVAAASARYQLAGRRVVVSAGGTREPIDPVRYISNYSSGKMGFAMAAAAADRGAEVVLVTTADHPSHPGIRVETVETAQEMLSTLQREGRGADMLVMAAAVADYRPTSKLDEKIRREETASLRLDLEKNVDILAELGRDEGGPAFRLGFAAEAGALEEKARDKLARKRLDAIVANDVSRHDIAFGSDYNAGLLVFKDGATIELGRTGKREMADRIIELVIPRLP